MKSVFNFKLFDEAGQPVTKGKKPLKDIIEELENLKGKYD